MGTNNTLDREQIIQFHRDGYVGPFTLCSPEEMEEYHGRIQREAAQNPEYEGGHSRDRHLDCPTIHRLCSDEALVAPLRSILGPDVTLWRSFLFQKPPGGDAFPWHQDSQFWDVEPPIAITAWIAVTDAKHDNGCVRLIPGSHKQAVPHEDNDPEGPGFTFRADEDYFDPDEHVDMELEPGEFVLFYNHTIHGSHRNSSDRDRLGIAARVATPYVYTEGSNPNVVISGEDRQGINDTITPPTP
jgi:ectoine hydroxylase-related dioxygenase (phytanoyl-CoA dioxygenase family)